MQETIRAGKVRAEIQRSGEESIGHAEVIERNRRALLRAAGRGVEQPELEVVQASDGAVAVGETALVSEGGGLGGDVGSSSEHEGQAGNKQGTMDGLHKQVWG